MDKLTPAPKTCIQPSKTLEDLDRVLQNSFKDNICGIDHICFVTPAMYAVPREELINKIIEAGYVVRNVNSPTIAVALTD